VKRRVRAHPAACKRRDRAIRSNSSCLLRKPCGISAPIPCAAQGITAICVQLTNKTVTAKANKAKKEREKSCFLLKNYSTSSTSRYFLFSAVRMVAGEYFFIFFKKNRKTLKQNSKISCYNIYEKENFPKIRGQKTHVGTPRSPDLRPRL
jgi:hypothetical protein